MTDSNGTDTEKRKMKKKKKREGDACEAATEEVCMCQESVVF